MAWRPNHIATHNQREVCGVLIARRQYVRWDAEMSKLSSNGDKSQGAPNKTKSMSFGNPTGTEKGDSDALYDYVTALKKVLADCF